MQLNKTLFIIGGATASGKTALAIEAAKFFNTQILNADSRQCYKELNIGVAKPSIEELNEIQHYFINTNSIHEIASAAFFENYGLQTLNKIFEQNNFAICTGGTGLYIKALCDGLDEMPAVNLSIESEVKLNFKQNGITWLQDKINKTDSYFAENGNMQNPARMMRALTFYLSNKQSILNYQTKQKQVRPFNIQYFCIDMPREILYDRINKRVDKMMQDGLLNEVINLMPHKNLSSLNTVGYTEIFEHLEGKATLEFAIDKIKQHTRNYAKRQITWFKNDGRFQILTPEKIMQEIKLLANKK